MCAIDRYHLYHSYRAHSISQVRLYAVPRLSRRGACSPLVVTVETRDVFVTPDRYAQISLPLYAGEHYQQVRVGKVEGEGVRGRERLVGGK